MKTRISGSFLGLGVLSLLAAPHFGGVASAQETLAGLGAASSIGAGLGAAAAGSAIKNPTMPRGAGEANALIDEAGNAGGAPKANDAVSQVAAPPKQTAPDPESYGLNPAQALNQLRKTPTLSTAPARVIVSKESKTARERRLARLSPQARKKEIQRQYKIAPVSWLGRYLPQDRYKFNKVWRYVSTEDSNYYYTPAGLARHKFNPNRVIGFRTWQDAMLAGYKPDPRTKPAPAADLVNLSHTGASDSLLKYTEYLYSGQVSETEHEKNMKYLIYVLKRIYAVPELRDQIPVVTSQILGAAAGQNELPRMAATREYWVKYAKDEADAAQRARAMSALNSMSLFGFGGRSFTIKPSWDLFGLFSKRVTLY